MCESISACIPSSLHCRRGRNLHRATMITTASAQPEKSIESTSAQYCARMRLNTGIPRQSYFLAFMFEDRPSGIMP